MDNGEDDDVKQTCDAQSICHAILLRHSSYIISQSPKAASIAYACRSTGHWALGKVRNYCLVSFLRCEEVSSVMYSPWSGEDGISRLLVPGELLRPDITCTPTDRGVGNSMIDDCR